MKVRVQYTAQLRTAIGHSGEDVELPEGSTVAALVRNLADQYDGNRALHFLAATGAIAPGLLVILNDSAVTPAGADSTRLQNGDVVSLLPPIAGG